MGRVRLVAVLLIMILALVGSAHVLTDDGGLIPVQSLAEIIGVIVLDINTVLVIVATMSLDKRIVQVYSRKINALIFTVTIMQTYQAAPPTPKGAQTRERLLDAAIQLFVDKGYAATTMQDIAAATNTSLGLTYRYFASKDEMVLAFYHRLAVELAADLDALPPAPLAERFVAIMQRKLERLAPYRTILGVLFSAGPTAQFGIAVLSERTADTRRLVGALFLAVVQGASDAPSAPQNRDLATVLYAAHLLLILFWLHDRSEQNRATHELLGMARPLLALTRRLLRLPPIAQILARFAQTIAPVFLPADDHETLVGSGA
jgi:AcrR family transcriptional regulator